MKKGLKLRYRIIILAVVFLGALYVFSKNYLVVRSFELTTDTTEPAKATLPNISLCVEGEEINRLYGYTSNLDWTLNRESITPLGADKSFSVRIEENETTVRRLKYELFDVTSGMLLDSGTISALTSEQTEEQSGETPSGIMPLGDKKVKTAKIRLNAELKAGTEYSVKLTLVTSKSKRVYYYTRVKLYENGHLNQKLAYVRWFRQSALDKQNREAVEKNLETKSNADTTSFARVDIHSPWAMVSWGDLTPRLIAELPPTITDFYEEMASVVLSYIVEMDTGSGPEQYMVREAFRFLYTDIRTYLYNYEREVEAAFDVSRTSLSKDDLKLGITAETKPSLLTTSKNEYTAFVRNRELWSYDKDENELIRVFSFRQGEGIDRMALYDAHDIKLLSLKENGDMDFLVYGYMNRGEYEGRVGIVLYRYLQDEHRLEEQLYIPVNTTYQLLKSEMNEFAYMNAVDVMYFTLYNTVFSFNLTTKALKRPAEQVLPERLVFLKGIHHAVWQSEADGQEKLTVLDLETGAQREIGAGEGEKLCLLGSIDNNLVYGFAREADIVRNADGTKTVPMYRVVIADLNGTVFKEYSQPDIYVTGAELRDNVIHLTRVRRADTRELRYQATAGDAIQNRTGQESSSVSINGRVTELGGTEYYISFPGNIDIKEIPKQKTVPFTVLSTDPTVRINPSESLPKQYMTYSFGRVVLCSRNVVDAIQRANADENVGAVIDSRGKVVWERGIQANRSVIGGLKPAARPMVGDESMDSRSRAELALQNALSMIFAYEGFDVDVFDLSFEEATVTERLEQFLKVTALDLRGAELDEVLYYVYKKHPVIAILREDEVVLITAYDKTTLEVTNPLDGSIKKLDREQAKELFSKSGNQFYSYMK